MRWSRMWGPVAGAHFGGWSFKRPPRRLPDQPRRAVHEGSPFTRRSGGGWPLRASSVVQLLGEQVHEQPVVPPGAVGVTLVAAQHTDGTEADCCVAPDRGRVVRRGIDREAVMAAVLYEVARQDPNSVSADTLTVHGGVEEDVYRRVPVHGVLLFVVLDQSAHRFVKQDGERCHGRVVEGPLRGEDLLAPAASYLGRLTNSPQLRHVLGEHRHQYDTLAAELGFASHEAISIAAV